MRKERGFLTVELMVVIFVMTMLIGMGAPAYKSYTQRAALLEVMQRVMPKKLEAELVCLESGASEEGKAIQEESRSGTISVSSGGVISFQGKGPLQGLTLTLTPNAHEGAVDWKLEVSTEDAKLKSVSESMLKPLLNASVL